MATVSSTSDQWYQLAQLNQQYQQSQQAMQQMANPMYIYGATTPYTTTTATFATNFSGWAQDTYQRMKLKFWRVNQVVEMEEGGNLGDSLDSLRISVARWLRPGEKYNLVS